jgi:hypothetical protein
MSEWRLKSTKLANACAQNADVLKDLSVMVHNSCSLIFTGVTSYSEQEAREKHQYLASLRDQLDQVVPIVNRIARVARSINAKRD